MDDELRSRIRRYLADCRKYREILDPRYHPTEAGAIKIIFHRGRLEAQQIRDAYRELCSTEAK